MYTKYFVLKPCIKNKFNIDVGISVFIDDVVSSRHTTLSQQRNNVVVTLKRSINVETTSKRRYICLLGWVQEVLEHFTTLKIAESFVPRVARGFGFPRSPNYIKLIYPYVVRTFVKWVVLVVVLLLIDDSEIFAIFYYNNYRHG